MTKLYLTPLFESIRSSENTMFVILMACNAMVALTGFAKDLSTAGYLGTTVAADAFADAYFIVDTLALSVLATALWIGTSAAFGVSVHKDSDATHRATVRMGILCSSLIAVLLFVALIGMRHPLVHLLAESPQAGDFMGTVYLALLPMAVAYPVSMVVTGALQTSGSYVSSTLAPGLLNLCVVSVALLCMLFQVKPTHGILFVALAYSLGGLMMLVLMLARWMRWEKSRHLAVRWNDALRMHSRDTLRTGCRVAVGYASYLTLQQLVGFVERYLAVGLGSGSVAALTYATRISQVPNWVVVSSMMVMVLPNVASALNRRDWAEATVLVKKVSRLVLMMCLPMAIVLSLWARPIVGLLLERGAFGQNSVEVTAEFLSTYALGIVTQSMAAVLFRTVASMGKMQWPILSSVVATTVNVLFDVLLLPKLGAATFGLGSFLCGIASCLTLGFCLYRERWVNAWLSKRDMVIVLISNILVVFACELIDRIWFTYVAGTSRIHQSAALLLAATAVGIMYLGVVSAGSRWVKGRGEQSWIETH